MLKIIVPGVEKFDEVKQEFIYTETTELELEHSLVSIAKWESKWHKSFMSNADKTTDEVIDYVRCMTLNPDVSDDIYDNLTNDNVSKVIQYINEPMTATTFNNLNDKPSREVITAEIIYYWMISFNIPMECQHWHLNRLTTLIKVFNIKNNPPKKMGKHELMSRNAALNAARKKQLNTKG